jgi:hypothetical protein
MRFVEGFAFGFRGNGITFMFGKKVDQNLKDRTYEALATNDLTLFESKADARQALGERNGFVVKLELEIAEADVEIETFKAARRASFIVIMRNVGPLNKDLEFLGRQTGTARAYPLPGAYLRQNDWKPFTSFAAAEWTAREAHRQGRCPVTIATMKIKRL